MKKKLRVTIFAVAITVLLLMALTMNSVSAEPPAKVRLIPVKPEVELNPQEQHIVELNPSEPMTFPTERALNELIYDDGTAEGANAWTNAGNGRAVRFTPLSYPVDLLTARICFSNNWPDSDHEEFAVYVYDDDGPSGIPGTCLGGPIHHTATAWGWCDVDISGLGITIVSGDFYILYKQLTDFPDCEGLCRDLSLPQYGRSWGYSSESWFLKNDENYMIRCVVDDDATDEWTVMVYLDGDNDLEGAAIDDFMEMSSVGSTPTVNIVVQFDRIPGYDTTYGDWETCKRFFVWPGMTPEAWNAICDLGECNMADPNTLDEFVTWSMTNYPADKYALILWNHGSGWKKSDWKDPNIDEFGRWICVDVTNGGDYLTLRETEQALTGKYVDLLGYDACLMHMMAVVYQMRTNAAVSVGSEEAEPPDGWPYDTILADLTVTPTMNEYTLGAVIVDRYMASYPTHNDLTQSAMANLGLPNLVTAVYNLAQALIIEINGGNMAQVQQARNAAAEMMYDNDYIDLYHFAEMVQSYVPGAVAEANAVMVAVSGSMYEAHGTSVPNDHGLSIYHPRYGGSYMASYGGTAFARDTQWNEFLMKYYYPEGGRLDDIAVYRNGMWYVDTNGDHGTDMTFWFGGGSIDVPVVGDISQDGTDDTAIYRNGMWYVDTNGDHGTDMTFWFGGGSADVPIVGDISQDGTDDTAIYRNGMWYVDTNGDHGTDMTFWFGGGSADVPIVGDINQDGTDDTAIYRNGMWYVDTNGDGLTDLAFWFGGGSVDVPVVGDISQDGTDDTAIYRNGMWYVDTNGDGLTDLAFWFGGGSADVPVVADIR